MHLTIPQKPTHTWVKDVESDLCLSLCYAVEKNYAQMAIAADRYMKQCSAISIPATTAIDIFALVAWFRFNSTV